MGSGLRDEECRHPPPLVTRPHTPDAEGSFVRWCKSPCKAKRPRGSARAARTNSRTSQTTFKEENLLLQRLGSKGTHRQKHRPNRSAVVSPVVPLFRALSGRLKFTARRHKFNKDSLSWDGLQARASDLTARACNSCEDQVLDGPASVEKGSKGRN